jgi:tetratricopeptide (TPR) repeat protein
MLKMLEEKPNPRMTIAEAIARAWNLHQAGHLDEAARQYRQVLDVAPTDTSVWHLLGAALHAQGNLGEAETCYLRALDLMPNLSEVHCNLGVIQMARGRIDDAIASYRRALQINPTFSEPSNNLGLALLEQGKPEEALASFRDAVRFKPDFAEGHYNLGSVLQRLGKPGEAVASYRRALEFRPTYADALNNLGAALTTLGILDDAAVALQQALAIEPRHADAHNNLGNVFRAQGRLDEAIACHQRALELRPNLAIAYNNLGMAYGAQWKLDDAVASFREAVRLQPDFAQAHYYLGAALQEQGRLDDAVRCYRRAIELEPSHADAYNDLSAVLTALRQTAEAAECLQAALRLKPRFPEAHCNLGVALGRMGEFAASEASLREALRLDPGHVRAYSELAFLLSGRLDDSHLAAMRQLSADARLADGDRSRLHFSLAKVYDARRAFGDAARHAEQANALDRAARRATGQIYDPAAHARSVDRIIATFTSEFFARVRGWGLETEQPIFVFGLPRSGTTLIEQILASHSIVHGAGEANLGRRALSLLAGGDGPTEMEALNFVDQDRLRRVAGHCLEQLQALGASLPTERGSPVRVVDKTPENYLDLGLLAALFPRARFIHCQRDVRDVALSCWLIQFAEINWANDVGFIASRIHDYRRLMEHWRRVLPAPIVEVAYEEIVANLEAEARRLLVGCGLNWERACLAFHETRRAVHTASFTQVRLPIYSDSVGRWRNYADALAPLFAHLDQTSSPIRKRDGAALIAWTDADSHAPGPTHGPA